MEMQPQKYNNVKGLSLIVTVGGYSEFIQMYMLTSILGHHRLQWILRHHRSVLENLSRLLLPANNHRTLAKSGHLHLHGHQHRLWLHLLRHRHIRLWRSSEFPPTHRATQVHLNS